MAPLWKSMLSKSSPLYRDSLYSFSLWEWKAQERELALLKKLTDRERRALLTQLNKLSKELQQKDKVIESLRTKLDQQQSHHYRNSNHRSETPCSSHALSDITDQSDRISYVSDEHGSTNEDLELCSEMDAASEFGEEERRASTRASTGGRPHSGAMSHQRSAPPSNASSHRAQSSVGSPSMQWSPRKTADTHSQTGAPFAPHEPLHSVPLLAPQQPDSSGLLPLSYHGLLPAPLGGTASGNLSTILKTSPAMQAEASVLESSALWDMACGGRAMRVGADLSSGSSGYQSGTSHTGSDLMKEHLREVRSLRQRLEHSIQTNDRLRQQLEERLASTSREKGAPTNIYIQGLDSLGQLSSEIRLLKEENLGLQNRLQQANRDGSMEADQLREATLLAKARLKEAERWAEESKRLQSEAQANSQEITQLKQEKQQNIEISNRLQHELSVLQQQLSEGHGLIHSLQRELQMYHRVCGVLHNTHSVGPAGESPQTGDGSMTYDPKELHLHLQHHLSGQADASPLARRQLFNESVLSPPVKDTGFFGPSSTLLSTQGPGEVPASVDTEAPALQDQAPDGSFASRHGCHMVGHVDDFKALQQQILEGSALVRKMEGFLDLLSNHGLQEENGQEQPPDTGSVRKLLANTKTLQQILQEAHSLLGMFWRAALPSSDKCNQSTKQRPLKGEIGSLRLKLSEQEDALRDAKERLRSCNLTKDSMESFILSQLSRTRDVLKKAKTNLEVRHQEASVSSTSLLVGAS